MIESPTDQLDKILDCQVWPEGDRKGWIQAKTQLLIAKNLEEINHSLKLLANHTKV